VRSIPAVIHELIGVEATASVGIISGSAQSLTAALLLQAVIVPGDKTAE
jgi:hypothetical protein